MSDSNVYRDAQNVAAQLQERLNKCSPKTELATVVDITYQYTVGYVTATNTKGPVQVYGCPNGAVIPGSKILTRQMVRDGMNFYIYDGPSLGSTKGAGFALMSSEFAGAIDGDGTQGLANTGTLDPAFPGSNFWTLASGGTSIASNSLLTGWYWNFFFLMSYLPVDSNSPASLMTTGVLKDSGLGWNLLNPRVEIFYDWKGRLGLAITGTGDSSIAYTTQTFAPGQIWFLQVVLGKGMSVNGIQVAPPSNISSLDMPFQGTVVHGISGTSDSFYTFTGSNKMRLGSWISKIQFGHHASLTGEFPYALNGFIPNNDSQILNGSAALGSGLRTYDRFIVSDGNSSTLPNTGISSAPMTLRFPSSWVSIGPYSS